MISGYAEAPDGSYRSFNGTDLTASPNTVQARVEAAIEAKTPLAIKVITR